MIVAAIVLWAFFLFMISPVFYQGPHRHPSQCLSNVKQQAIGVILYSIEHEDQLPIGDWMTSIGPKLKNESVLHCPEVPEGTRYGYAFNSNLLGAKVNRFSDPAEVLMVYDSTSSARSSADPLTSLPPGGRHGTGPKRNTGAYLDGHAANIRAPASPAR